MSSLALVLGSMLASPAIAEDGAGSATYNKGFEIKSDDGKYKMAIGGRLQLRYTFEAAAVDDEPEYESNFMLRRARIAMKGHAHTDKLRYKIQLAFDKGAVGLKDYYFDIGEKDKLNLRVGQYKTPWSRQQLNSSGKLAQVDRAITDKAFGGGRDIGLMLHNNVTRGEGTEASIGLFNGPSEKSYLEGDVLVDPTTGEGEITGGGFSNEVATFGPELVGRIAVGSEGLNGYDEIDWKGGGFRGGVGVSAGADFDLDDGDDGLARAELDLIGRASYFTITGAGYLLTAQDGAGFGDQTLAAVGGHTGLNYLIAEKVDVSGRFALVADQIDDATTTEIAAGLGYHFKKHKLKLSNDAGVIMDDATNVFARSQAQLAF